MDTPKLQLSFFAILFTVIFVMALLVFWPFFKVLALSAVLAVVFHPLYLRINEAYRNKPSLAAGTVMLLMIICVVVPLVLVGSNIFDQSRDLYFRLSSGDTNYLDTVVHSIEEPLRTWFPNLVIDIRSYVDEAVRWIGSYAGALLTGTALTIFNLFLGLIAFFYFLKDGLAFKKTVIELSPLSDDIDKHIFDKLEVSVNTVIKGTLLVALIQGLLAGLGLLIFGVPNATLWGVVAVVAAIVPGLGTALVIAPAVLYLFLIGSVGKAVALGLWGVLMVGLIDNALTPILYSRSIEIHPVIILFSVLGGIAFFGPLGFIFGPLIITLLFVLLKVYKVIVLKTGNL